MKLSLEAIFAYIDSPPEQMPTYCECSFTLIAARAPTYLLTIECQQRNSSPEMLAFQSGRHRRLSAEPPEKRSAEFMTIKLEHHFVLENQL
jgi:hypothetical protein